jgi:hypothetical protein
MIKWKYVEMILNFIQILGTGRSENWSGIGFDTPAFPFPSRDEGRKERTDPFPLLRDSIISR